MNEHLHTLTDVARANIWPDRWMTLKEISDELAERGFWGRTGLKAWSEEGRIHWLRVALAMARQGSRRRTAWLRIGGEYKPFDLVIQSRQDVNAYLDWESEVREARVRHAEMLLEGKDPLSEGTLHPLAPPSEECLQRAEAFALQMIDAMPDQEVADRMRNSWATYEALRPASLLPCLRVCRLFFAMATLYLDSLRKSGVVLSNDAPEPIRRLRRIVREADDWVGSLYCSAWEPEEEVQHLESA